MSTTLKVVLIILAVLFSFYLFKEKAITSIKNRNACWSTAITQLQYQDCMR